MSPDPEYYLPHTHDHYHRKLKPNVPQSLHDSHIHSNSLPLLAKAGKHSKLGGYTDAGSMEYLPEINYNSIANTEKRIPKKVKMVNNNYN